MKTENSISEELKSMDSFLADYSRRMPYSVPEGFFAKFAGNVQTTIKELSEQDIAPGWSKKMPFPVPGGYFETLTSNIVGAVSVADITSGLPKSPPHHIPAGYFDKFPAHILGAAKATDPVVVKQHRTIPFKRHKVSNPIRWAAAAVILMCIGLGSYEAFYSRQHPNPENILASVTNNDIQDYLQGTYRVDVEHILANNDITNLEVDNKDIVQYLDETGWDQTE